MLIKSCCDGVEGEGPGDSGFCGGVIGGSDSSGCCGVREG